MRKFLYLLVLIILATHVTAVGVSPPRIILEDVPKGYSLEKVVILSDIKPGVILTTTMTGEGAEWVQPTLGYEFAASDETLEFPFAISIPDKAPNGNYEVTAQIVASTDQKSLEPNSATVSSGILVDIQFSVSGDEIKKFSITNVQIPNSEVGSPLFVIMNINNEGNVLAKPKQVDLLLKNKKKEILTSYSSEEITSVDPFTTGISIAAFDVSLEPGFYFADVAIYTDTSIEETLDFPFDIFERGTFQAEGELLRIEVQENVEDIAKIEAFFANTGTIDLYPTLHAEVYREEKLVDFFKSESVFVRNGETNKFTHYYNVPRGGEYTVRAHVEFLGKTSNTQEATFISSQVVGSENLLDIGLGITIIVLICVIIILWRKRRNAF